LGCLATSLEDSGKSVKYVRNDYLLAIYRLYHYNWDTMT